MATETKKTPAEEAAAADAKTAEQNKTSAAAGAGSAGQTTQPKDKDTSLTQEEQGALKDIAQERVNHDAQAMASAPQNPMGTMPTQAFHPGAGATQEEIDAYRRANPAALNEDPDLSGASVGEPVECLVKKDFYDSRGAYVRAGERYYWTPQKLPNGKLEAFPFPILEPINKATAKAKAKEYQDHLDEVSSESKARQQRVDAFRKLADETSI